MVIIVSIRGKSASKLHIFIADRINKGEPEIKYFPTEYMIMYYFAKPLQEKLLIKFCKYIMNLRE